MKNWKMVVIPVVILALAIVIISQNLPQQMSGKDVVIEMTSQQFKYTPNQITVHLGDHVILKITALDVPHGFQLDEFHVYNVQCPPGETVTVTFTATKTGQFTYYCTVFCGAGHPDHYGTLTVI